MKSVEKQMDAQDVADENVVDRKEVGLDVHHNDEARIFFADEIFHDVELGIRDWKPGHLPERSANAVVVVVVVHSD
jgi:hypothetical protein